MALIIAEALVPVFFVMFLGYFAGARRIIDNQHVASLNVLLMTFALPVALFAGVAKTSRSGLEENGKLVFVLLISMLVIFGITFALNHYVFRLSSGENAVQSLSVGFPNYAAVGLPLLGSVMGPGSMVSVAVSVAAGSLFISPLTQAVLESCGTAAGSSSHRIATALFHSVCKPVVIGPVAGLAVAFLGIHLNEVVSHALNLIGATAAVATATSDLDLLIRAPERLPMQVAQKLVTIFSGSPCRVDAQLETPRGAVSLTEYASGQTPLLLRHAGGPVLISDPWA